MVEPLNNRHFRTSNFWDNFTARQVWSLKNKIVLPWEPQNLYSTENIISYNYSECLLREVHYAMYIRVPILQWQTN